MAVVAVVGGRVVGSGGSVYAPSAGIGTPAYFQNYDLLTPGAAAPFNSFNFATVDNTQFFDSPNSVKSVLTNGGFNFGGSEALAAQPSVGDEVWFRIRTFFPVGFNFQSSPHLKFMRIDTGPLAGSTHAHLDWYLFNGGLNAPGDFDFIYEGLPSQGLSGSGWMFGGAGATTVPTGITQGAWNTFEIYYKLGLTTGTSIIRLWRDGTLLVDTLNNVPSGVTPMATLVSSAYTVGALAQAGSNGGGYMWCTYWNGGSPQAQTGWLDDFTVYTSLTGRPTAMDANGNLFIGTGPP